MSIFRFEYKRLKPTAYPSKSLPTTALLKLPNPYNRPRTEKRVIRHRNSFQPLDESIISHLSSTESDSETETDLEKDYSDCFNSDVKLNSTVLSFTNVQKDSMHRDIHTGYEQEVENKYETTYDTAMSAGGKYGPSVVQNDVSKSSAGDLEFETLTKTLDQKISGRGKKKTTLINLIKTDRDAVVWTGVASLEQLDAICISVRIIEEQSYKISFKMSAIDRVILTLVKLKQNISFIALATLFGVASSTVSQYFNHSMQLR